MGFEWAYRNSDLPPWDIDRPQPAIVRLAEQGAFTGSVIDLGCGTGENALYLASRGLDVTGLDAAPTAIERAGRKAQARGIGATFVVADALELETLARTFDAGFDCGLFHVFSDGDRIRFERGLRKLIAPGGRYYILCFSDRQPGTAGPRRVSQAEIRATFTSGWRVDSIVAERFATRDGNPELQAPLAWLASITRLADGAAADDEDGDVARGASRTAPGAAGLRAEHLLLDQQPRSRPAPRDRLDGPAGRTDRALMVGR